MAHDLKALGIEQMSVEERLELIDAIWETIPESSSLLPSLREELDRRLDEYEAGGVPLIPAEQVIADIRARLNNNVPSH
jgi:putative addiction module component (TIGR02574 family)